MPLTSRFHLAFAHWLRHNPDRAHRLWGIPEYAEDAIILPVCRFAPHVTIHLSRRGVNVAVEWDGECWDLLFADDLVAIHGAEGWQCELCLGDDVASFNTLEELWTNHLFEPATRWAEEKLVPARVLYLSGVQGATWASLSADVDVLPSAVRFAVFARETA